MSFWHPRKLEEKMMMGAFMIPYGLDSVLIGTVTIDPPSIGAGSTVNVDVTVSGLTTNHRVIVMCQSDLEHGLMPIAAYVPAPDTLRVRITNFTGSAIDGAARTWFYIAWIP
jgi:hypothetical protein